MSTARYIKDDAMARKERYRRADEARQQLHHNFHHLGGSIDRDLRDRVTNIHANQAALDAQSRALQQQTNKLTKTTKTWSGMADGARGKLKEIGDVQNWAEMIEHDLMLIEETLRIVHDDDGDMGHEGDDRHQQHYASPSSGAGSSFVSR